MSALQASPLVGRVSEVLRPTAARVVLGGAVAAWVLVGLSWWGGLAGRAAGMPHAHHGHAMQPGAAVDVVDPLSMAWALSWLLMVAAMMWPLAVPTIGAVTRSGFRGWRTRLALACLATVTALWMVAGLAVALLARSLSVPAGSIWWQLAGTGLALVAFRSARRGRLLERCLRIPTLAPGGRRGLVTAARAGALTWRRCCLLCGPVMLAMAVGHSPVLMVCGSASAWWEAWHPRAWRDPVPVLLVAAAAGWLAFDALLVGGVGRG